MPYIPQGTLRYSTDSDNHRVFDRDKEGMNSNNLSNIGYAMRRNPALIPNYPYDLQGYCPHTGTDSAQDLSQHIPAGHGIGTYLS